MGVKLKTITSPHRRPFKVPVPTKSQELFFDKLADEPVVYGILDHRHDFGRRNASYLFYDTSFISEDESKGYT